MCHICEEKLDAILAPYHSGSEMALALRVLHGFEERHAYWVNHDLLCPCGLSIVHVSMNNVHVSHLSHSGRWVRRFVRHISKAN